MVSTTSISSMGSLRTFVERAFSRRTTGPARMPETQASCAAPLPHPETPPPAEVPMTGS